MKNSVEIRCPFLDINLIRLLPMKTKLKKQTFLKKFFDKKVLNLISKQKKKIGFFCTYERIIIQIKKNSIII